MSIHLKFFYIVLVLLPVLAQANDDSAFGAFGLYPTGSTRVLAMGGAFVGLADDASSVISNPAGVSMSRWRFDLQGTTNRVVNREGDINLDGTNDGYPYNFVYTAAAVRFGFLGLGAGYSTPYDAHEDFGGSSSSEQKILIESYDVTLSLRFFKNFAIGATLHQERASMSFRDNFYNEQAEDSDEYVYPTAGIIFRPQRKWGIGITYSPERRYAIDDNLNDQLTSTYKWFQDLVIPAKLSLGFSLKMKKRLTIVGDMDIYYLTKDTYLMGSDSFDSSNKFIEKQYPIWHGGFELEVIDRKNIEFIWRGGGYQEPARLVGRSPRFHFTMGVEVRFGFVKFSAAYDQAKDFTSFSQSVGLSISDLR